MSEEIKEVAAGAPEPGVGEILRAAREAKGLSLEQVASETRISMRHLQQIEAGSFEGLPGRTYAVGFAKSFAKTVGLNQNEIADKVRAEMELEPISTPVSSDFEPGDASRGPSGRLVWFSLFAVVLLLAGLFFAGQHVFGGDVEWDPMVEDSPSGEEIIAADDDADDVAISDASGSVVFTAQDAVWVRFTDAAGLVLMESEMAAGESFAVPSDADGPLLITGRPDLLEITIGGQSVPKLSNEPETIVDVPVSAAALLARDAQTLPEQVEVDTDATPSAPRTSQPTPAASPSAAPARSTRDAGADAGARAGARAGADAGTETPAARPQPSFVSEPVVQELDPTPQPQQPVPDSDANSDQEAAEEPSDEETTQTP